MLQTNYHKITKTFLTFTHCVSPIPTIFSTISSIRCYSIHKSTNRDGLYSVTYATMFCARVYKFEQRLNKVKDHSFTDPFSHCTVAVAPYSIPSGVKYLPLVTSGRLPQDFSKKYNYVLIFMLCTINKTKINLKIIIIIF